MENNKLYIIIIVVASFTILFRLLPLFIKIPENNEYLNTFFDILPVSILTVLALPEIFTSIGNDTKNIILTIIAVFLVLYLTYKNKSLGIIAFSSVILINVLRGINFGNF